MFLLHNKVSYTKFLLLSQEENAVLPPDGTARNKNTNTPSTSSSCTLVTPTTAQLNTSFNLLYYILGSTIKAYSEPVNLVHISTPQFINIHFNIISDLHTRCSRQSVAVRPAENSAHIFIISKWVTRTVHLTPYSICLIRPAYGLTG